LSVHEKKTLEYSVPEGRGEGLDDKGVAVVFRNFFLLSVGLERGEALYVELMIKTTNGGIAGNQAFDRKGEE